MGLEPKSTEAACHALLNEHCMRLTEQEIESLMDLAIAKANQHLAVNKHRRVINANILSNNIDTVLKDRVILGMIESLESREIVQAE